MMQATISHCAAGCDSATWQRMPVRVWYLLVDMGCHHLSVLVKHVTHNASCIGTLALV